MSGEIDTSREAVERVVADLRDEGCLFSRDEVADLLEAVDRERRGFHAANVTAAEMWRAMKVRAEAAEARATKLAGEHDARVAELLAANNAEVERRREAERERDEAREVRDYLNREAAWLNTERRVAMTSASESEAEVARLKPIEEALQNLIRVKAMRFGRGGPNSESEKKLALTRAWMRLQDVMAGGKAENGYVAPRHNRIDAFTDSAEVSRTP